MTEQDRARWNARYLKRSFTDSPSSIVSHYHSMASKGRALDLAAGNGRNTLFLADKGFRIDAVDISDVAMERLKDKAHPRVTPLCVDLDTYDIPESTYDLIINIRFLDRRLFPAMKEGLKRGGVLIFESYLMPPPSVDAGGSCHDYFLRNNELLHAFISLDIRFYQETKTASPGKRNRVARLVGVKK